MISAGIDDRPEAMRRAWATMSEPEREAYRHGMRVEVDRVMETARNPARAGEAVADTGFNRDKLEIAFGRRETDRLMNAFEDTRSMAATNNAALGGSDTAHRTAARESVAVRAQRGAVTLPFHAVAGIAGGVPGVGASLALEGGYRGVGHLLRRADMTRNRLLANDLTAAGPQGEAVVNRLMAYMQEQAAPTWLPRLANDPSVNLLFQATGRASSRQ